MGIILLACTLNSGIHAQMLKDTETLGLIESGIANIYNFQFDQARAIYRRIKHSFPEHPIPFLFRGLITYWENYPLLPESAARQSFENDMYACIRLCEEDCPPAYEAEFLMANLSARGLLLLFYADNEISIEVFSVAATTYKHVKRAFDFQSTYQDFYFITGLYNYYREAYPEAHPIYKPVALFFPKGDKQAGLRELNLAANHAIFLKAEAHSFLSGIYISFENNFQQAYHFSKSLHELFPANIQYLTVYIKNLLLIKKYDEAEAIINESVDVSQNKYFQAQLTILNGILYEKKYKNLKAAWTYYMNGINATSPYGVYAGEYNAYAYFGLSRISASNDNTRIARNYRKEALDQADYENVNFDD